jgi:hypothetical protein
MKKRRLEWNDVEGVLLNVLTAIFNALKVTANGLQSRHGEEDFILFNDVEYEMICQANKLPKNPAVLRYNKSR